MNDLQKRLVEFRGALLIPLNYQTYQSSRIERIPSEGYMYVIAEVNTTHVHIPAVDRSFEKGELLSKCKEPKLSIAIFLAKLIQSDLELLKECKLNRLGFDKEKYPPTGKPINTQPWVDKKREEAFVIKVLKSKKDFTNLAAFTKRSARSNKTSKRK